MLTLKSMSVFINCFIFHRGCLLNKGDQNYFHETRVFSICVCVHVYNTCPRSHLTSLIRSRLIYIDLSELGVGGDDVLIIVRKHTY